MRISTEKVPQTLLTLQAVTHPQSFSFSNCSAGESVSPNLWNVDERLLNNYFFYTNLSGKVKVNRQILREKTKILIFNCTELQPGTTIKEQVGQDIRITTVCWREYADDK